MRIINDSDTTTFTDPDGDTLTLLDCPRQKDVEKSNALEREDAFEQLDILKRMGFDPMEAANNATEEEKAKAIETNKARPLPLAVRRFRFGAIARELKIGGMKYGGEAILDSYDKMPTESIIWADEQVATIWSKTNPGDAEREGTGAGA